jgi:hypothetical protein
MLLYRHIRCTWWILGCCPVGVQQGLVLQVRELLLRLWLMPSGRAVGVLSHYGERRIRCAVTGR